MGDVNYVSYARDLPTLSVHPSKKANWEWLKPLLTELNYPELTNYGEDKKKLVKRVLRLALDKNTNPETGQFVLLGDGNSPEQLKHRGMATIFEISGRGNQHTITDLFHSIMPEKDAKLLITSSGLDASRFDRMARGLHVAYFLRSENLQRDGGKISQTSLMRLFAYEMADPITALTFFGSLVQIAQDNGIDLTGRFEENGRAKQSNLSKITEAQQLLLYDLKNCYIRFQGGAAHLNGSGILRWAPYSNVPFRSARALGVRIDTGGSKQIK